MVPKLEKIYSCVFGNRSLSNEVLRYKDLYAEIDNDYKIDYSSWDVINLIEVFNKNIYEELIWYSNFIKNTKIRKLIYYLKYERSLVYDRINAKLKKIPIIGFLIIIIFKILKRIKNILFCDHYKLLKDENEELRGEIRVIKKKMSEYHEDK